jgi:AraC family transcriptional regulator
MEAAAMQTQVCETIDCQTIGRNRSCDWMHDVIALLDAAIGHLHQQQAAHGAILEATSLLRKQIDPQTAAGTGDDGKERLLTWQARKVLDYIDRHITSRVLVADLCALVWRSEAHFSRSFKGTFGCSPHAFVVRRRVELAAKYMLQTDLSLSDTALGCGFADQAHLCKHFRALTGETPAAWRRAKRRIPRTWKTRDNVCAGVAQSNPSAPAVDTACARVCTASLMKMPLT